MIGEIQVAPRPADPTAVPYPHVDAAIAVIKASGLVSEVGAMGTTLEGTPDEIWSVLRAAHEAVLADGAASVISHIKVAGAAGDRSPRIADLVTKHRP